MQDDRLQIQVTPMSTPRSPPPHQRSQSPHNISVPQPIGRVSPQQDSKRQQGAAATDKAALDAKAPPPMIVSGPLSSATPGSIGMLSPVSGLPTPGLSLASPSAQQENGERISPRMGADVKGMTRITSSIHRSPRNAEQGEGKKVCMGLSKEQDRHVKRADA